MAGADGSRADVERAAARAQTYELIEALQASPGSENLDQLLADAQERGWWDIVFLLHYALFAQIQRAGLDCSDEIAQLLVTADQAGDSVLLALALATQAEHAFASADYAVTESVESDLARAVALLEQGPGSGVDAPTAYVACGLAYHVRGLWELEEEMYEVAARLLEDDLPPPLDRTQRTARRLIPYNRREALLSWACGLFEVGEREAAADVARRGLALSMEVAGLPREWVEEIAAIDHLLAAIAGAPRPVPLEVIQARVEPLSWVASLACVRLAEAIWAHDAGDHGASAAFAGQALTGLGGYMSSARFLALHLCARQPPVHDAALRYAGEQARERWEARLGMVGSARARIEGARIVLEHHRLTQHAYVDQLTGLANRHAYSRYLERLRNVDEGHPIAVLMVDVDHFKTVNDVHGHTVGDHVLRRLADVLAEGARATDLVARLGGDEFLVLLDAVDLPVAAGRAQNLLDRIAKASWTEIADDLTVSVSIGLAAGTAHAIDDLLEAADSSLYQVKKSERGTVRHA